MISLPSQSTAFKFDLDDETATIVKADVAVLNSNIEKISIRSSNKFQLFHISDYSYLVCLLNGGNILTFNLPSLKQNNNLALSFTHQGKEEM